MLQKVCTTCKELKPLSSFYRRSASKDGYATICKDCHRSYMHYYNKYIVKLPQGALYRTKEGLIRQKTQKGSGFAWSEAALSTLKCKYPKTTTQSVATDLGCSVRTVERKARQLGLTKDPIYLRKVKRDNVRVMQRHNKVCPIKQDLTNFIEAGKRYRFTKGNESLFKGSTAESSKKSHIQVEEG